MQWKNDVSIIKKLFVSPQDIPKIARKKVMEIKKLLWRLKNQKKI